MVVNQAKARVISSSRSAEQRLAATVCFSPRHSSSSGINSGERKGRKTRVMPAAVAASRTRCGWWGGALSQISSFGTAGRTWPRSVIAATMSSVRQRRSGRLTSSPVATFSAPKRVRRAWRPLMVTSAGCPTRLQPARKGGNSRRAVSSATQTSPPAASIAWAASLTAPFFRHRPDLGDRARTAAASSGSPGA